MGGKEGLEGGTGSHVHTGTHVEMGVDKERETAQKTTPGTGGGAGEQG